MVVLGGRRFLMSEVPLYASRCDEAAARRAGKRKEGRREQGV
eukprot:CAMPEP_0180143198 /NCGR_PEP_ID=MMETSP0986-20121125/16112_1 /TAXON_ID=697907 /ORGANISM="non described non described, Strain CCMP2293" /LENGTH=41 /DNA_ID= /DNA_START= /DNA_END= /DNA_ORIENTATION=